MTQQERLDILVDRFKEDSGQYRDLQVPDNIMDKRRILRSLMNIRLPGELDKETLQIQDAYLQERNAENGIVSVEEIAPISASGSRMPHADQIAVWQGDITRLAADAIVNAANSQMLGCFVPLHTCIDNCIHTFAGVQLRAECDRNMQSLRMRYGRSYEQPTAVPMLNDAYNLPAKKIIHVVGPVVQGRLTKEHEQLLSACYTSCLDLAAENGLESIAFCCISTGVFMFPNQRAAEIAVETVRNWLDETGSRMKVVFNVYKDLDLKIYSKLCK